MGEGELPTYATKRIPVLKEEIENDHSFAQHLVDIHNGQQILNRLPDNRPKAIIHFFYSTINRCFFLSAAVPGNPINIGKLAFYDNRIVPPSHFKMLYRLYEKHFLVVEKKSFSSKDAKELQLIFTWLFNFFVLPITNILRLNSHLAISSDITIEGISYFVEFSHIFNLRYRYGHNIEGEDFLITNVTGYTISKYIESLSSLPFPEVSSMNVLFGLKNNNFNVPDDLKIKVRQKTFEKIFEIVQQIGGKVYDFVSAEQFLNLCKKGMENNIIQVISHFKRIDRYDYLFTIKGTIRFDKILKEIILLKNNGLLRNDIVLDAKTCANFHAVRILYTYGIKLIYLSPLNLENNLIAFMLYELYSCHNAQRVGILTPYIDGKSYLHEAWGKVFRTFYRLMYEGKPPEIP